MAACMRWLRQEKDRASAADTIDLRQVNDGVRGIVGVFNMGRTELIFVDPVAKINGACYLEVLLTDKLYFLSCVSFFIFQQPNPPFTEHATHSTF